MALALLLLALASSGWAQARPLPDTVRVSLAQGPGHARLDLQGGWSVKGLDGARVLARGQGPARLWRGAAGLRVEGEVHPLPARLVPAAGAFSYQGRRFRGWLEIHTAEGGGLLLVNRVPLEAYLASVLGGELAPHWPLETQKALAVAARTYAVYQVWREVEDDGGPRSPLHDLFATVRDQVYPGVAGESARARAAVAATRGQVLLQPGGGPIKAYYHSSCGGRTCASEEVFGLRVPRLVGVADPSCAPPPVWAQAFEVEEIRARVAPGLGSVSWLGPVARDGSGRIRAFALRGRAGEEVRCSGHRLRMALGPGRLRSTLARMEVVEADGQGRPRRVRFRGTGWGHGVGLCQWGAEGMGRQGADYRAILARYYPGARLAPPP